MSGGVSSLRNLNTMFFSARLCWICKTDWGKYLSLPSCGAMSTSKAMRLRLLMRPCLAQSAACSHLEDTPPTPGGVKGWGLQVGSASWVASGVRACRLRHGATTYAAVTLLLYDLVKTNRQQIMHRVLTLIDNPRCARVFALVV